MTDAADQLRPFETEYEVAGWSSVAPAATAPHQRTSEHANNGDFP
jgi:hypothetical protein